MMEDATTLIASASKASLTGEKRKREGGKLRSRVWQHFTRLEKKPGEREECRCNYCGQLYACSSRCGTTHLNRHIFDGGCPQYSKHHSSDPTVDIATPISFLCADLDYDRRAIPLRNDSWDSCQKDTTPNHVNYVNMLSFHNL